MTTNLPSLSNIQIPAYLQARMGKPSALVEAALTGGGGSTPRISIKQSRFRLVEDGVETPLDSLFLECTIVDIMPGVSKTYYMKSYNPGDEPTRPDCSSLLGDVPAADSPAPQAATCAECPMNAWGSKITPAGKETKACADTRRVAVVPADDPAGTMYLLTVPAASMLDFKKYVKELGMRGIKPENVRTRISFDASTDFPKLVFQFAGFLDEEGIIAAESRVCSLESKDVIGLLRQSTAPALAAPKPAPAPQAAAPKPAPAPAPKPAAPVVESNVPPPAAAKGFGKKPAAAPAPAPQAAPQPAPVVVAEGSEGLSALESQLDAMLNG